MTRLQTGQKIKFNDTTTPGWKDGTIRSETTRNDPKIIVDDQTGDSMILAARYVKEHQPAQ